MRTIFLEINIETGFVTGWGVDMQDAPSIEIETDHIFFSEIGVNKEKYILVDGELKERVV